MLEDKRTETCRVETGYFNFTDRPEGHDDRVRSASNWNIAVVNGPRLLLMT